MTATDKSLSDLLTIRDYLRDRRDELYESRDYERMKVVASEVVHVNAMIMEAEKEAKK